MNVYLAAWEDVKASWHQLVAGWHTSRSYGVPCVATHAGKHWTFHNYSFIQRLRIRIRSRCDL